MQPFIVMMMMTFFAQWRFLGCYTLANTEVLVLNGAAVMACVFMLWYTIWGFVQKTHLLGVCIHFGLFFWYPCNLGTLQAEVSLLHGFSVYEVIHVACLSWSLSLFMPTWQTSHANNFVNAKSYAKDKPDLLAGYNLGN